MAEGNTKEYISIRPQEENKSVAQIPDDGKKKGIMMMWHGRDTDMLRTGRERQLVTSKRWELTFFPFFIHVIRGLGSPAAWHTKDATPPEIPVWSSGDLMKFGKP